MSYVEEGRSVFLVLFFCSAAYLGQLNDFFGGKLNLDKDNCNGHNTLKSKTIVEWYNIKLK